MKKVVYLAAGEAVISVPGCNVVYNDLYLSRDLKCDLLDVKLSDFDIVLASPPCNFYSRANYRRYSSNYSLLTKNLLPRILADLIVLGCPFIVENVINKKLMSSVDPFLKKLIAGEVLGVFYYEFGRHCYFTNVDMSAYSFKFEPSNVANVCSRKRQGSGGVNIVFSEFLNKVVNQI